MSPHRDEISIAYSYMLSSESRKQKILLLKILFALIALWLFFWWIIPLLDTPEIRAVVARGGIIGPIAMIIYIVLSHIFAPVSGSPALFIGATVFGAYKAIFYLYIAGLISSIISFYISKKFGRNLTIKLVGRNNVHKVDEFVKSFGTEVLILGRLFGFAIFDVISYAAGLTKISFIRFFIITAIFLIPSKIVYAYILDQDAIPVQVHFIIFMLFLAIGGIIFSFLFKKISKKNTNN